MVEAVALIVCFVLLIVLVESVIDRADEDRR